MLMTCAFACLLISQHTNAQQIASNDFNHPEVLRSNFRIAEIPLKNVFRQIENKFDVSIAYKSGLIKNKKLAIDVNSFSSADDA